MKNKILLFLYALGLSLSVSAQYPANYYQNAKGKSGSSLKTALYSIISSNTVTISYDGLFNVYKDSDIRPDGKIWDMYSNATNYSPGDHSSYSKEGDCYNREHSVPQSWFSKGSPMKSDAFHVVPTDGYVNNRRSNFPFGETNNPTYQSKNGFSKVGPCGVSGYSGTVFEPNDEYKGDFARIYFYMATRYENVISNWSGGVFGQSKYPGIIKWQLDMLLKWSREDPVSQKEINRNNAVYKHQKNRNPFVDFPGLEEYVWGTKTNQQFDPNNYDNTPGSGDDPDPSQTVSVPEFSIASGVVAAGTRVTITSSVSGASIEYSINNNTSVVAPSPVSIVINETSSIKARTVSGNNYSQYVTATYTVQSTSPEGASNIFRLVSSKDQLIAGREYLIVCEGKDVALGVQGNDIRGYADVRINNGVIETEVGDSGQPFALVLGGSEGNWSLYDPVGKVYLALSSSANKLHTSTAANSANSLWSITFSGSSATISNNAYPTRSIQYNSGAPRFACYTGGQQAVQLYLRDKVEPQPKPEETDARLLRAKSILRMLAKEAGKALIK